MTGTIANVLEVIHQPDVTPLGKGYVQNRWVRCALMNWIMVDPRLNANPLW